MKQEEFKEFISDLTILYIEDDEDIRKYISEFLQRYCQNLYESSTAEEGLNLYKEHKPNIIIADINLPKMSGMELISLIRKNDKKTKIIISTAYTNKEFTIEAIELYISRYLVKPITSNDLMEALKKAVNELNEEGLISKNIDLGEGFYFNNRNKILMKENKEVELRRKEFQILEFFINKNEDLISYETLQNEVWEDEIMTENSIRSQIKNIRRKTHNKIFTNVSGIGYKLYSSCND